MSGQRQIEILNGIVSAMHASAKAGYDSMRCEFEYEANQGGWTAGAKYFYTHSGECISEHLVAAGDVYELLHELHGMMKAKTGGDWKALLIEVGEDGKASTKFNY